MHIPNLERATSDAFTASDNSMGSSGGTTLVMIRIQSRRSLDFFKPLSMPVESNDMEHQQPRCRERRTFYPDIPTGCDSENEKETDEEE